MLEQPPPIIDPKLQLQQPEYRPPSTNRRQRPRSNRRGSSGSGAAANAAAVAPGRVNAVGIPGQYMQPVSLFCLITLFMLFGCLLNTTCSSRRSSICSVLWS